MKYLKRTAYIFSAMLFSALTLIAQSPVANANSYFGGNGRLTFYSPVTLDDTTQEVYTVNADGSDLQLVSNGGVADSTPQANPQWNPDADAIAYDTYVDGTQQQDIYIQPINPDGTANGSDSVLSGANTTEREFDPSWNPAGDTIAFHRRSEVGGSGPYHIKTISASGGTVNHLTGIADGTGVDADFQDTEPTWSKDGDYVTFTRRDTATDATSIAIVPASGDETDVVIIDDTDGSGSPQWSPVDNKVVYRQNGNIVIADLGADISAITGPSDVTTSTLVTDADGFAPTWSPDGTIIAGSANAGMFYYSASTGELLHSVDSADLTDVAQTGIHELDWARAAVPPSTEHECTTYVNTDCDEFDPEIPGPCETGLNASIITDAENGTPKYTNSNFLYTPDKDFVGEDQYVYQYYDSNLNAITCTVNITVLPRAPAAGEAPANRTGLVIGAVTAAGALSVAYARNKRLFRR